MISNLSSKESGCGCGGGGSTSASPCSCGGAGCGSCVAQGIVRPRFFAGQLLTEDDLQLLGDYVGQKNRLHNRHLFGAGVVCGLEVTCDPCGDGRVIVQPGYAIDCCGNDLTLSCPQVVDLNALVRKLRKDDCVDPCPEPKQLKGQTNGNGDTDQPKPNFRFCLYIRYCEQPSDPVTPYSTGEDCVQVGCEPTRIREGVSFELRCVDPHMARNPLIERLCLALGDLDRLPRIFEAFRQLQNGTGTLKAEQKKAALRADFERKKSENESIKAGPIQPSRQESEETRRFLLVTKGAFDTVRNWLIERVSKSSFTTDCTLKNRVYNLSLPRLEDQTEKELAIAAETCKNLAVMFIDYLRGSVCRVLNPACLPCDDSAVLLACLDWEECEVKRICNMERTFVMSPAAVRYWLPPLQLVGNLLERFCCVPWEDFPKKDQRDKDQLNDDQSTDDESEKDQDTPDLLTVLKEEARRIVKDSLCGISDASLDKMMDRLEQMVRGESNDDNTMHLNVPGGAQSMEREEGKGEAPKTLDQSMITVASKVATKKTVMKSTKKATTKTASKAAEGGTATSKPAEAQPAATPPAAPAPTPAPAADAGSTTTPAKGDEK